MDKIVQRIINLWYKLTNKNSKEKRNVTATSERFMSSNGRVWNSIDDFIMSYHMNHDNIVPIKVEVEEYE